MTSDDGELPIGCPVPTLQNPEPPSQRPLVGRYITLKPPEPDRDAPELFLISHGSEEKRRLWTYMPYGPFSNENALRDWLDEQAQSVDPLFFVVTDNVRGGCLGMLSFLNIVPVMRRLELGHIWYGPIAQHSRTNTEAVYLMLCETFDRLHYRRAEWKCDALNARSRTAALRLGFSYEGLFRQHSIVKGRNRDTAWFAMMDHEWPKVKANMERWLYSSEPGLSLRQLNQANGLTPERRAL